MQNIITVDFHGQPILTICEDGQHYVGMKAVCENIGLGWHGQWERINRHAVLKPTVRVIRTVAEDGKPRDMVCLPLEYLNGWLFGVDVSRIKDAAVRERLTQYQRECFTVLYNYWHSGKAENPRLSTVADRVPLKDAVNLLVARAGISYSDAYRMVHQRFAVDSVEELTLEQLPQSVEYVHKLVLSGELLPREETPPEDIRSHQVCAIALMHTGWRRFEEQQRATRQLQGSIGAALGALDVAKAHLQAAFGDANAILHGSGAIWDGLHEALFHLHLPVDVMKEGRQRAETNYTPRILA
jgi:putative antirepressor protein